MRPKRYTPAFGGHVINVSHSQDREAEFRVLFNDVYPDAVRFAMRRAESSEADEAVASAMLIAWRRFDRAPASLDARRAWVFGIVRNTILNARRSQVRRAALAIRVANELPLPGADDLAGVELRMDLAAAWRKLAPAQQEVLALSVFEQLDATNAARTLGILPTTYRMRLSRARRALREALQRDDALEPGPTAHPHPFAPQEA